MGENQTIENMSRDQLVEAVGQQNEYIKQLQSNIGAQTMHFSMSILAHKELFPVEYIQGIVNGIMNMLPAPEFDQEPLEEDEQQG